MTFSCARRLLIAALILCAGGDVLAGQAPPPFLWWRSEQFKKELNMSADQIARIDKIFQTTRPELIQEMDELRKYDGKLQKLIETSTDEALLARQIDRVETARANLNKTRSLMIARMRLVLSVEQRARFKALYEERERENRGPGQSDQRDGRRPSSENSKPQTSQSITRPGC